MPPFELNQRYPLTWLSNESEGYWVVDGLIKALSPSEAIVFLAQSTDGVVRHDFPSSKVCLVGFRSDKVATNVENVEEALCDIKKLWVMLVEESAVVPIRVVLRPISFAFNRYGQSSLTVPMSPPLNADEWERLGLKYTSLAVVNTTEEHRIATERDVEELCRYLTTMSSFFLQASRFEGSQLDVTADENGVSVFFLDIDRGVKLISLNRSCTDVESVVRKVDAVFDLDAETERRHLITLERALGILRAFLNKGEPIDMVPWPLDD